MVKLLIADGSVLMRERLKAMLSELTGVEIIGEARDGIEAIGLIQKLKPDVVILDIRMPKCSGISVLESMANDGVTPTVIVLTSYPFPQYRKRCIEAGAHFFFDKAQEFDRIPEVLKELIGNNETGKIKEIYD